MATVSATTDPREARLLAIASERAKAESKIKDAQQMRYLAEKDMADGRAACIRLQAEEERLREAVATAQVQMLERAMNPNAPKDIGYKVPLNPPRVVKPGAAPAEAVKS